MRSTHKLLISDNLITAIGNDRYFSWIIEYSSGEWDLSTIYGRRIASYKTFEEALNKIDYKSSRESQSEKNFKVPYICGVDKAEPGGDRTGFILMDSEMLLNTYWSSLPKSSKRKIDINWGK